MAANRGHAGVARHLLARGAERDAEDARWVEGGRGHS